MTAVTKLEGYHCKMPEPASDKEVKIYRAIHRMNCSRKDEPDHTCMGQLTIDSKGVTLSCPYCGDVRKAYPPSPKTEKDHG